MPQLDDSTIAKRPRERQESPVSKGLRERRESAVSKLLRKAQSKQAPSVPSEAPEQPVSDPFGKSMAEEGVDTTPVRSQAGTSQMPNLIRAQSGLGGDFDPRLTVPDAGGGPSLAGRFGKQLANQAVLELVEQARSSTHIRWRFVRGSKRQRWRVNRRNPKHPNGTGGCCGSQTLLGSIHACTS